MNSKTETTLSSKRNCVSPCHESATATANQQASGGGESFNTTNQRLTRLTRRASKRPALTLQFHYVTCFCIYNILASKKQLCDVQLMAGGTEVPAHRVVLASCSPYFCAMFTGDMSESKAHQVEIREVDGLTLQKLIDYIYTAEIEITEDNVQVLLPAASLLQLMDVRQVCCEFLQSQLHPSNCLGIRAFADLHTCTQLLNQAHAYAEQHFSEVVQGEEFLSLSLQQVCSLISSDKLTVSTEEKVFEAMISWIKYDKPSRLEYMSKLMEHVRLPLLSRDYLVQIVEEEALIKNNNTCKDFLIEAMKYHLLPADQRHLIKTDRTRPRTPISIPKVHRSALNQNQGKTTWLNPAFY
uniref:BTB domain-containing protein n=1 Tax=Periophthalmus magnuspinnatus TaxID=409849 RepID=A0A3B4AU40_9GOBI